LLGAGRVYLRGLGLRAIGPSSDARIVDTALSRGAKVGVANLLGWTALHHAALLGPRGDTQRLVTQLMEAGAQPTDKNGAGHVSPQQPILCCL